jgi:hypothetical protein
MPTPTPRDPDDQLYTQVDDATYASLAELAGQRIVFAAVWEDSLADALGELAGALPEPESVDIDLYLHDGVYFELYGTVCYPTLESDPLPDRAAAERRLVDLVGQGVWLEEIAVDEEEGLVLVLAQHHRPVLFLQVGAWILDEWDELPDGASS